MSIFMIVVGRDGRRWLECHRNAGPAVFHSKMDAEAHVETVKATGVEYEVIEIQASIA